MKGEGESNAAADAVAGEGTKRNYDSHPITMKTMMMMTTVVLPVVNECLQRAERAWSRGANIRKGVKSDTSAGKGRQ